MSEKEQETRETKEGQAENGGDGGEEARARNARERMSDGWNRGLGILSAFKEALEETISEARERGDLSVDKAREAMKGAMDKAREATSDARERFDFVGQAEFDALVKRVQELEERLGKREGGGSGEG